MEQRRTAQSSSVYTFTLRCISTLMHPSLSQGELHVSSVLRIVECFLASASDIFSYYVQEFQKIGFSCVPLLVKRSFACAFRFHGHIFHHEYLPARSFSAVSLPTRPLDRPPCRLRALSKKSPSQNNGENNKSNCLSLERRTN